MNIIFTELFPLICCYKCDICRVIYSSTRKHSLKTDLHDFIFKKVIVLQLNKIDIDSQHTFVSMTYLNRKLNLKCDEIRILGLFSSCNNFLLLSGNKIRLTLIDNTTESNCT